MNIEQQIKLITELESKIRNHPMCYRFIEKADRYEVDYPEGDFSFPGIIFLKQDNKLGALTGLLRLIEKEWVTSYPQGKIPG